MLKVLEDIEQRLRSDRIIITSEAREKHLLHIPAPIKPSPHPNSSLHSPMTNRNGGTNKTLEGETLLTPPPSPYPVLPPTNPPPNVPGLKD